jgi:FlaG/FlaF family flagellin (archaellin)
MLLVNGSGSGFLRCLAGTVNAAFAGTLQIAGAVTLSGGLAVALPINQGGSGVTTVAGANQAFTPSTVTVTESAGAASINWASGSAFYLALNANCTISFSGAQDGQVITVLILNTGSNYTVTWPTIKWPGGSAPVQTTGAHYDLYTLVYNATVGAYYGVAAQNY